MQKELCQTCERSKRPSIEYVVEIWLKFNKLKLRSIECKALLMLINRVILWQEKFSKLFVLKEFKILRNLVGIFILKLPKNKFTDKDIEVSTYI